jgi:hypothetical protein
MSDKSKPTAKAVDENPQVILDRLATKQITEEEGTRLLEQHYDRVFGGSALTRTLKTLFT